MFFEQDTTWYQTRAKP